jgi:hypothetical protein
MFFYFFIFHIMNIHQQFVQLGRKRNSITNELLALLPEIYEKEIYREKGYGSIYEYAGVLAGLSHSAVEKVLQTMPHLKDKPFLAETVKTEGIHKVAIVAKLATPETDKAYADKVVNMNRESLFELAREIRGQEDDEVPCKAPEQKLTIELDGEMQFLFFKLKKEMKKKMNRRNLSNKEVLREMLVARTNSITGKVLAKRTKRVVQKERVAVKEAQKCVTRYIPAAQQREELQKTNGKCAYANCNKPKDVFHHRERFSNKKSHESVISLCKQHHQFMHNGLIQNELEEPAQWRLVLSDGVEQVADTLFRKYRRV